MSEARLQLNGQSTKGKKAGQLSGPAALSTLGRTPMVNLIGVGVQAGLAYCGNTGLRWRKDAMRSEKGAGLEVGVMKTRQMPDKKLHVRKKVAGGATGAVLGAVMGGPVGALVGGVIGTVVGDAAEQGKLQQPETRAPRKARQLTTKARNISTRVKKETKATAKKAKRSARQMKRSASAVASKTRRAVKRR